MDESLYCAVFAATPDALLVFDEARQVLAANRAAGALFRRDQLTGAAIASLFQEPLPALNAQRDAVLRRADGSEVNVRLSLTPVSGDRPALMLLTIVDITHRARTEVERRMFLALAESSPEFIGMCDAEFCPFYVNPAGLRLIGLPSLEAARAIRVQDCFFPEDQAFVATTFLPRVATDGSGEVEIRFRHFVTGAAIWMLYNVFALRNRDGGIDGWATVSRNIHDRRRAEESLRESEQRLRLAQQAAGIGSFEWNVETGVNTWTPELEAMYGLKPGDFSRTQRAWEELVHPDDRAHATALVTRAFQTGQGVAGEWRVRQPDGTVRWLAGRFQVFFDAAGRPQRLAGINQDVTERKQLDEALRRAHEELERRVDERTAELVAALADKDMLLREIHHRVKNNLAVISSLLYLASTHTSDPEASVALNESRERIRSMALVHEALHKSAGLDALDFGAYLKELLPHILRGFGSPERFALDVAVGAIPMDLDTAIPCGLIVNELVSNALKHAFPGDRRGRIRLDLDRNASGRYLLTVQDDGVGLPPGFSFGGGRSLGLHLVQSLTRQLSGAFELRSVDPGVEARVSFQAVPR